MKRSDWPWLAALGLSLGLFHVGLNFCVYLNGAAVTAIQQAAMPAMVIVVERIIWRESLTRNKMISLILDFFRNGSDLGSDGPRKNERFNGGSPGGLRIPALYGAWSLLGKKCAGTTTRCL